MSSSSSEKSSSKHREVIVKGDSKSRSESGRSGSEKRDSLGGKRGKEEKREKESKSNSSPTTSSTSPRHSVTTFTDEDELEIHEVSSDLQEHAASCDVIREAMEKIRRHKASGKHGSEIPELKSVAAQQFVTLKRLNRVGHLRVHRAREKTNEKKAKVDAYHLRLQNLLYEVIHLQKEIDKCLEFKSRDEDIDLVSIDEFQKEAPEEIANPTLFKDNPHEERKARLAWELEQRKALDEKHKKMERSKEDIAKEISSKREYLESLQPKLKNILESTKPVQDYLDMPFDKTREQHRMAAFLPRPLYVLFVQTSAYQEACDSKNTMTVTIAGDLEAAKAERASGKRAGSGADLPGAEEEDEEEEEDGGKAGRGKRSRRKKEKGDKRAETKEILQEQHPLRVEVFLRCQDESSLHLSFVFLLFFKVVAVRTRVGLVDARLASSTGGGPLLDARALLDCLTPGDLGVETPNAANKFSADLEAIENGLPGTSGLRGLFFSIGKPYLWAQWLAGLQFLPPAQEKSLDEINDDDEEEEEKIDDDDDMDVDDDIGYAISDDEDDDATAASSSQSSQSDADPSSSSSSPKASSSAREKRLSSSSKHKTRDVGHAHSPNSASPKDVILNRSSSLTPREMAAAFRVVRPKVQVSAGNMDSTMKALRSRVAARIALAKQIQALNGDAPQAASSSIRGPAILQPVEMRTLFPKRIVSTVTSWSTISWSSFSDASANPHAKQLVDAGLVRDFHFFFRAVAEHRPAGFTMEALVAVAPDYPSTPPLFALRLKSGDAAAAERTHLNDDGVREIEAELNLHPDDLVNKAAGGSKSLLSSLRHSLLTVQLRRLLVCLDIFVETSPSTTSDGANILVRRSRGPSRSRPYQFDAELGIFHQR